MKLLKTKKFYLLLFLLILIGFLVYQNFFTGKSSKKEISAAVNHGTLKQTITISGVVAAEEHVTLRFQTSGRLVWVGVKEGDYVQKYQSIASLDQRELQKELEKDLNDYLTARWNLDDAKKDTYKDIIITNPIKRIIDKYQYTLNKSVLDVELQNISKEYANLWTPIEGIVTKTGSPYAGVNITPATSEFEIVNPKTVYFSATADQTEVILLTKDLSGNLVLDAYPESTISGTIKDISFIPKSGESSTVYEIKFNFTNDNTDYRYRLGMAGDLSFVTKSKDNVLFIPNKFIKNQNGSKYVYTKINGKKVKTDVQTGMETDTQTEISEGLQAGETVYE